MKYASLHFTHSIAALACERTREMKRARPLPVLLPDSFPVYQFVRFTNQACVHAFCAFISILEPTPFPPHILSRIHPLSHVRQPSRERVNRGEYPADNEITNVLLLARSHNGWYDVGMDWLDITLLILRAISSIKVVRDCVAWRESYDERIRWW